MRIILLLLLLFGMGITPVLACSPTATPQGYIAPVIGLSDYVQQAPVIFAGSVLGDVDGASRGIRYEIEVESYLKGSGYNIVQIDGYGYGTECLPLIWENSRQIFFVQEHQNSSGIPVYTLITDYPLAELEAVQAITGQANPPLVWPLYIQLSRTVERGDLSWLYFPLSLFAAFVGLPALGLSLRMRNHRKSKAKRDVID